MVQANYEKLSFLSIKKVLPKQHGLLCSYLNRQGLVYSYSNVLKRANYWFTQHVPLWSREICQQSQRPIFLLKKGKSSASKKGERVERESRSLLWYRKQKEPYDRTACGPANIFKLWSSWSSRHRKGTRGGLSKSAVSGLQSGCKYCLLTRVSSTTNTRQLRSSRRPTKAGRSQCAALSVLRLNMSRWHDVGAPSATKVIKSEVLNEIAMDSK